MGHQDKILSIVRQRGPLLPSQINKDLGVNVLFASAMLGELCDKRLLRLTKLKVGGSPLYYLPGQEPKLTGFADKLGEKDRRAYDLLKQEGVVLDSEQDALFRIALRSIPDFAVPLDVTAQGQRHIFWKWYLLQNQDAEKKIMAKLGISKEEDAAPATQTDDLPPTDTQPALQEQVITVGVTGMTSIEANGPDDAPPPVGKRAPQGPPTHPVRQKETATHSAERKEEKSRKSAADKKSKDRMQDEMPNRLHDMFHRQVLEYFERNGIKVESADIVRAGADIEFLIHLPTSVGLIPYFCKAKNKKRCDDDDMARAYLAGQTRRLPTLFLYTGDLTRKAKDAAASEYRTVILREI